MRLSWVTDSNLGTLYNGQISTLGVQAVASDGSAVVYSIVGGSSIPKSLYFNQATGDISGRLSFQSTSSVQPLNQSTTYTFTIRATSVSNPAVYIEQSFSLTTVQKFTDPYSNLYVKALLPQTDRDEIIQMLNNSNIINPNYIYRPTDPYFGRAQDVVYQHLYGVPTSQLCEYINAVQLNHYRRDITMGQLQTAVARDANDNIIYEVVYSEIIDNLVNAQGKSVSKSIIWPRLIDGSISTVYPASLPNMRIQFGDNLELNTDPAILPSWMTSQQTNRDIVGYIQAFVLCYTKPGYSNFIRDNINLLWPKKLNQFQYSIDRLTVDNSLTYQYNVSTQTWSALPSNIAGFTGTGYDTTTMNSYDQYVYLLNNILSQPSYLTDCP